MIQRMHGKNATTLQLLVVWITVGALSTVYFILQQRQIITVRDTTNRAIKACQTIEQGHIAFNKVLDQLEQYNRNSNTIPKDQKANNIATLVSLHLPKVLCTKQDLLEQRKGTS